MTLKRLALALCMAAVFGGCRRGPDADTVKTQVQTHLDEAFGPGQFAIDAFKRRGSSVYSAEGDTRDHVLIYFDATLSFTKAATLSGWDGPGAGSLASILGAKPRGIVGVTAAGNKAGDPLKVRGSAAFVKDGDSWVPTAFHAVQKAQKGPKPNDELPVYKDRLARLATLGEALQKRNNPKDIALIEAELDRAIRVAGRRLARRNGKITLSTGAPGGHYHRLGVALAKALTAAGSPSEAFPSSGSLQNGRLVADAEVTFGLAQNDVAQMLQTGQGQSGVAYPNLRALCTLYPEPVQVIAHTLQGFEQLRDKRVSIGPEGSGVRVNALQVLTAAGLTLADLGAVSSLSIQDGLAALRAGELDAVFLTSATPSKAVTAALHNTELGLVPLSDTLVAKLAETHPFYLPFTIPARTYPNQRAAVQTVAVTATLVTRAATDPKVVTHVLETLFDSVEVIAEDSPVAFYITKKTARSGLSIPLHPAAEAFLSRP